MRPLSVSHGEYTYIIPDFRFFVKRYGKRIFLCMERGLWRIFTHLALLTRKKNLTFRVQGDTIAVSYDGIVLRYT